MIKTKRAVRIYELLSFRGIGEEGFILLGRFLNAIPI
jgi:hypothetical protein